MARLREALAAAALVVGGPTWASAQGPSLVIEHADQVQRLAQGDSISYYLDGNVRARRGDLRLTAEHAVVLEWLGLLDLSRNVHLWDARKELYADHVTYAESTDVAVATGNVQIIDRRTGSQLKSQRAVYDRPAGVLTATEGPEMMLLPEEEPAAEPGSRGPGGAVEAVEPAPAGEQGVAADSAPPPIRVWGELIEVLAEGDEVRATGDVLIQRGDSLVAKADTARFAVVEERLELRSRPRVETDRFYVEAAEIDVLLPEDRLAGLVARGGARASSTSDSIPPLALQALGEPSPSSWLAGDSLRFAFEEGALRTLWANGNARSLNYALESMAGDAATWALSFLLASRIGLHFDAAGQSVERVEATNGGRGIYRTAAVAGEGAEPLAPRERAAGVAAAPGAGAKVPEASATAPPRAPTPAPGGGMQGEASAPPPAAEGRRALGGAP